MYVPHIVYYGPVDYGFFCKESVRVAKNIFVSFYMPSKSVSNPCSSRGGPVLNHVVEAFNQIGVHSLSEADSSFGACSFCMCFLCNFPDVVVACKPVKIWDHLAHSMWVL